MRSQKQVQIEKHPDVPVNYCISANSLAIYVSGNDNVVADALSRIESIQCPTTIDFAEVARAQETEQLTQYNHPNSTVQF